MGHRSPYSDFMAREYAKLYQQMYRANLIGTQEVLERMLRQEPGR